jgi:hypothetical protein
MEGGLLIFLQVSQCVDHCQSQLIRVASRDWIPVELEDVRSLRLKMTQCWIPALDSHDSFALAKDS